MALAGEQSIALTRAPDVEVTDHWQDRVGLSRHRVCRDMMPAHRRDQRTASEIGSGSLPGHFTALPDHATRGSQAYTGFGKLAGRACHLSMPRCDTYPGTVRSRRL